MSGIRNNKQSVLHVQSFNDIDSVIDALEKCKTMDNVVDNWFELSAQYLKDHPDVTDMGIRRLACCVAGIALDKWFTSNPRTLVQLPDRFKKILPTTEDPLLHKLYDTALSVSLGMILGLTQTGLIRVKG